MTSIQMFKEKFPSAPSHSNITSVTDTSSLAPCSHEQADTRLILHASARHGFVRVITKTTGTDVVILAISNSHAINDVELYEAIVQESISNTYLCIKLHISLDQGKPSLSCSSMHSQDVILCPFLWAKARQQSGRYAGLPTGHQGISAPCYRS